MVLILNMKNEGGTDKILVDSLFVERHEHFLLLLFLPFFLYYISLNYTMSPF